MHPQEGWAQLGPSAAELEGAEVELLRGGLRLSGNIGVIWGLYRV